MQTTNLPIPAQRAFDTIRAAVESMVDDPSSLLFTWDIIGPEIYFKVRTAQADLGKIIGRNGRTVRALRVVLSAMTTQHKLAIRLDVDGLSAGTPDEGHCKARGWHRSLFECSLQIAVSLFLLSIFVAASWVNAAGIIASGSVAIIFLLRAYRRRSASQSVELSSRKAG